MYIPITVCTLFALAAVSTSTTTAQVTTLPTIYVISQPQVVGANSASRNSQESVRTSNDRIINDDRRISDRDRIGIDDRRVSDRVGIDDRISIDDRIRDRVSIDDRVRDRIGIDDRISIDDRIRDRVGIDDRIDGISSRSRSDILRALEDAYDEIDRLLARLDRANIRCGISQSGIDDIDLPIIDSRRDRLDRASRPQIQISTRNSNSASSDQRTSNQAQRPQVIIAQKATNSSGTNRP